MSYGLLQAAKLADFKIPAFLSTRGKPFWTFVGVGSLGSFFRKKSTYLPKRLLLQFFRLEDGLGKYLKKSIHFI